MACFNCFQKFTPRWKSLLMKVYPRDPSQGLRKAYMEKLMYYVAKNPEKVDKMGKYILRRLLSDLSRHRYEYCKLTMEAVDEMLRRVSDSHALNMLAGPYLEMIKALLEERDAANLWLIASESFAKFANIPEDTPSHHRTCDFLIERFTALCFFSESSSVVEFKRVRVAGIKGVRGVIRKTMKDTLQQTSFWNQNAGEKHLEKMMPALIFNIEIAYFADSDGSVPEVEMESPPANEEPGSVASDCLKELIGNVPYTHVRHIMEPLLVYLDQDSNRLWRVPRGVQFATHVLKIVINHVKEQSCHIVVEAVLEHLLRHCRTENPDGTALQPSEAHVRTAIANAFRSCCLLVSTMLTNPSANEILRKLVSLLQRSVLRTRTRSEVSTLGAYGELNAPSGTTSSGDDEASFQVALLNAIVDFAINVQDFQKIQLIEFMLKRVSEFDMQEPASNVTAAQFTAARAVFRVCLLETMLKVASTYETRTLSDALTRTLLDPLLQLASLGAVDAHSSLLAEKILLSLLDRSHNRDLLLASRMHVYRSHEQLANGLPLSGPVRSSRERCTLKFPSHAALNDTFFMQNHAELLFRKMVTIAITATSIDHFEHIYAILAVLYLEIAQFDFVVEFYRVLITLQTAATQLNVSTIANETSEDDAEANQTSLVVFQRCALHSMVASLFSLNACIMNDPNSKSQNRALLDYVIKVIDSRAENAPFLLSDVTCNRQATDGDFPESLDAFTAFDELMFDADKLLNELKSSGVAKQNATLAPPSDWLTDAERQHKSTSHHPEGRLHAGNTNLSDTQSITSEMSSIEAALIEPQAKLVAASGASRSFLGNFENRPDDEEDGVSVDDVALLDGNFDSNGRLRSSTNASQPSGTLPQSGKLIAQQASFTDDQLSQHALDTLKQNRIVSLIEAQRAASSKRYEILDKLLATQDDGEVPHGRKLIKEDGEDEFPNLFMY